MSTCLPVRFHSLGIFQKLLAAQKAVGAGERGNNCQYQESLRNKTREREREAKESNRNTDGDRKEPKVGRVN